MHPSVPRPSALFVGRDAELARLRDKLEQVPIAVIYGVAGIGKSTLACALAASWHGPVAYRKAGDEEPVAALLDDVRRQLAGGPVSEAATDDERLEDLVQRMVRIGLDALGGKPLPGAAGPCRRSRRRRSDRRVPSRPVPG